MKNQIKVSIARRFARIMGLLMALIVIGGVFLFFNIEQTKLKYEEQIRVTDQKVHYALLIQQNMSGAISDSRGYMAFALPEFLEKVDEKKLALEEALDSFDNLANTMEDRQYLQSLNAAKDRFFNIMLPAEIHLTDIGDREGLVRLSQEERYTAFIDELRERNIDYMLKLDQESDALRSDYFQTLRYNDIKFAIYLVVITIFVGLFAVRFAREFGRPLQILARSLEGDGENIKQLPFDQRRDEIGYLTFSLKDMFSRIQSNERELKDQNDELQNQQEELISQQEELSFTMAKMQEHERILEAQTALSTSLINTLDRKELLQSIIRNLLIIQKADIGAIILNEPGYPHASIGVNDKNMKVFITALDEDIKTGVFHERDIFVVTREAMPEEKGYHGSKITLSDLYMPIFSYENKLVAVVKTTRLGREFNQEAIVQAKAIVKQITLSLDKLKTYEKSENERLLNQKIIDSIREGIQLFDENGKLLQLNDTWRTWYENDTSTKEISFECLLETIENKVVEPEQLVSFVVAAVRNHVTENEVLIYRIKGQQQRFIQVYFEKLYDLQGEYKGIIFVHRDITKEHEIDRMKSEFVSTVSHELRTPLSSVLGFTELMLLRELKPERQKQYLQTIHKETKRLTQLINDFLDIQRMESGNQVYDKKAIDLIKLLQETLEVFSVQNTSYQFVLNHDENDVHVLGDESKIKQVFINLISNAVKFSPQAREINLKLNVMHDTVNIDVADKGLGIPPEAMANLFKKFYRIDNSDRREIGGTGLGLAISKEIIEAHNGHIAVKSQLGEGSTFTVSLPTLSDASLVYDAQSESDGFNYKPHVLIIEDDNSLMSLLKEELEGSGFVVSCYSGGGEALTAIEASPPDAIVIDIMLNNSLNGWDVIDELRKKDIQVPIFISSALDEKARGIAMGARDYLTKPYPPSNLSKSILHALLHNEKQSVIMVPESAGTKNE